MHGECGVVHGLGGRASGVTAAGWWRVGRTAVVPVTFWDALDHNREMPVLPATPKVFFRDTVG